MRHADWKGTHGLAWKVKPNSEESKKTSPAVGACLVQWLMSLPQSHPFWHGYLFSLTHLRDLAGVPPAEKSYPEAEYEFSIYALNPELALPDPDGEPFEPPLLHPANLVTQFHGLDDAAAIASTEVLARGFVDGYMSPDTDYREATVRVFRRTIEHHILGGHPFKTVH